MIKNKLILVLLLISVFGNNALGTNKVLFVHGYESTSQSWKDKNTDDDFVNPPDGQGSIVANLGDIEYVDYDLAYYYALYYNNLPLLRTRLFEVVSNKINSSPNDNWLIVSHSLGGLLTRGALTQLNNPDQVKGIITLSTPHQGAAAANVEMNGAQIFVNNFRADVEAGPDVGASMWSLAANFLDFVNDGDLAGLASALYVTDLVDYGFAEAQDYITGATTIDAASLMGPNGNWIDFINDQPPINIAHRAIMGAERSATLIRWLSEFGIEAAEDLNETDFEHYYAEIADWYSDNYWAFDNWVNVYTICHLWDCPAYDNAVDKRDAWELGKDAWDDLDDSWAGAIGAGTWYTITDVWTSGGYMECDGGGAVESIKNGTFDFEALLALPPSEDCWWVPFESVVNSVEVYVATKNDGLIQPQLGLWNLTDDWSPGNILNMQGQNNYYYPDVGESGGWNHSEVMRYTRIYDGDNTSAANIVTPLRHNASWMAQVY